jgi:hypothetical protein
MRYRLAFAALVIISVALGAMFGVVIRDTNQREARGLVCFEVSCGSKIQGLFNDATALLHSLRYADSERAYEAISTLEADCAMAYWGVAMSRLKRPVAITPAPDDVRAGRDALRLAAKARIATSREPAAVSCRDGLGY